MDRPIANVIDGRLVPAAHVSQDELFGPVITVQQFADEDEAVRWANGFKHSGYGKDLWMYGFEDYTRIKHVMTNLEA